MILLKESSGGLEFDAGYALLGAYLGRLFPVDNNGYAAALTSLQSAGIIEEWSIMSKRRD
jgi:hypothetical protein